MRASLPGLTTDLLQYNVPYHGALITTLGARGRAIQKPSARSAGNLLELCPFPPRATAVGRARPETSHTSVSDQGFPGACRMNEHE
jgi:hypothetical protein